jgi:hypothetical protein
MAQLVRGSTESLVRYTLSRPIFRFLTWPSNAMVLTFMSDG